MMLFRPVFWFFVLFYYKIARADASNVIDTEQKQLQKNLKVLRNDFNKIVETIEDFAGDFLIQIRETGKVMGNTYIGDNDYDWQDDNSNTIEKTTKPIQFSLEPITKTPKITLDKTATFPKLDLLQIPKLITKNNEQELSNHIEKRKKRSTREVLQEFENRPSPPPMMLQDGHLISAQINENHRQNSDTPMSAFTPFSDRITNVRENNAEQDNFFNNRVGQRSAASKFSHFEDRNTQIAKLGEKDNFLNKKANHISSAPILLEFPPFINIRGNELKQEKFVTDTLGQKSAESTLSQFSPYTDKTINIQEGKEEKNNILNDIGDQRSAAEILSQFPPFTDRTINIREGKEEKNNILNDIGDQRSAAEILSQFPPFTDKTINIREGKEEKNNILNDIGDQRSAADILSQFPPFTDRTINIREGKEEKNNILNDIGDQRSAAEILSQFPPFTDKTINIREGKEEKNNILNDIGDQRSAADILSQFPPFSDNTANVRGDNVEQDNFLNDEQTPAGSILLKFPPFTDRTVNVRKEELSKNHFLNDAAMLSEFFPFTDIRRERTEYDTVLNDNNGQRSSSIKLQESPSFTEKTTNVREDRRQQGDFLELKDSVQEQTQTGTFPQKQKTKRPLICTAKTQKEVELEKRKMDELQEEVKKLNELVALLKDQQKIINIFSDVDKYWENEANKKGYSENGIENSFLYQTLKQLQNNRIANRVNTLTRYDQEDNSNTQVVKFGKLENHIQDPIPTFKDLERIKMDLRVTAENLNKTKESLMIEKQKENKFEQELKRQSSELKFLKAMTENLYDKMGNKYDDKTGVETYRNDQKLRSSDFKDSDVDSLLESVHTPKTMPAASQKQSSVSSESPPNSMGTETSKKLESLSLTHDFPIDFTKPLTRDELLFIEHSDNYNKLMDKWSEDKAFVDYLGKNLMIDYGNNTLKGLRELAKQEKNTYKKFFPNTKSRESNPEDNQDTNMHDFLTHLKLEGSKNNNGHYNSQKINQNKENAFQEKFQKNLNKGNNTYLPMIARASSSGKMDDIDFKLKLLEMLTREEKSDDTIIKEKALNEAMKKLLAPEKKSDDDQLTTLMALLKEKRDGPNFGSDSQENLKKLFIELNMKPQSKNDDIDIEKELRQLQRAINSLKPKEDSLFNNMDLDNFLNNGKGKQNGEIQSMLSQIVAQNSESATSPMGVDTTGARPNLGGNTDPAVQELLSQYLATSNTASHKNKINYGPTSSYSGSPYANFYEPNSNLIDSNINSYGVVPSSYRPNPYIPNSIYGLGTNSYQANIKPYGPNSNSYGKDFNLYNPNSNIYASNIHPYGPSPNSYAYSLHPYGSNLYSPSPYSNPYYNSKTYGPNSDSYGSPYGFDNLGSDTGSSSYENEYLGQKEYGARPAFLGPYSSGNYKLPNPFIGYSRAPSYVPNPYQFNYAPSKSGYSPSSYSNLAFGGYPGSTQGATRYQTGDPSGTASQKYVSKDYTSAGTSYQGSFDKYSGVPQGNQAVYGSTTEQNEAGVYQNYGKRFFPNPRPFTNTAANYQGNSYGTKGYARPSMDQPYGNGQNDNQYKESLAADLVKQIESLESAIKGLSRRDYTQTPADKATVASLDQRIYELKGVISSLNQASYGPQPSSYQKNSIPYGSKPPETMFVQNQESYQPQLNSAPYGGMSQNGSPQNAYGPSSQTVYKPTTISGQIQPSNGHNSYSSSNASPPQLPYDSNSQTQITYANASPPQASNPQTNYPPNQPSGSTYNPKQSTQHSNSPQSYQTGPQGDTYPPSQPASSSLYQPKAALREDRRLPHGMHQELQELRNTGSEKSRRVRQINDMEAPRIPPRAALYENDDAGMTIDPRQGFGVEPNRPVERPIGYNLGDDTLTQIANIFKKYLEENLTPDENGKMPQQYPPTNNQESRNSAVATLQEKLDLLKKQLGSPPQYEKSLSNYFVRPSVAHYYPPPPIPYGSNNMLNNQFKISGITSLEKTFSDKKQDVFTQIVLKILEKVLGALPSVLSRLFGNLATSVGNSYGDNYSPLQNVFKNLGAVGFLPLILIRLLDTINVIVQHLGKNKFFKKFLLPGGVVAGAGLVILFLVYFFQQDEPYGYIDYQGNNYKHPKYESSSYGHDNYGATDYNNNGNYRSNPPLPDYDNNLYGNNMKQVLDGENLGTYNNPIFNSKGIDNNRGGEEEVPLQYSRGYYDFDRYNIRTYNNPNFNRRSSDNFNDGGSSIAPVQYSKGYYDYIKNPKTFHDPHLGDKSIGNFYDGEGNVPLQHSKGYYDYFEDRFIPNRNKDVYR